MRRLIGLLPQPKSFGQNDQVLLHEPMMHSFPPRINHRPYINSYVFRQEAI
jgi:hypothetical protein